MLGVRDVKGEATDASCSDSDIPACATFKAWKSHSSSVLTRKTQQLTSQPSRDPLLQDMFCVQQSLFTPWVCSTLRGPPVRCRVQGKNGDESMGKFIFHRPHSHPLPAAEDRFGSALFFSTYLLPHFMQVVWVLCLLPPGESSGGFCKADESVFEITNCKNLCLGQLLHGKDHTVGSGLNQYWW